MIVGYKTESHNYKRNIIGILHDVEYKKLRDLFHLTQLFVRYISRITRRKIPFSNSNFSLKFNDLNFNRITTFIFPMQLVLAYAVDYDI